MILLRIEMLNFVVDDKGAIGVRQASFKLPNVFILNRTS